MKKLLFFICIFSLLSVSAPAENIRFEVTVDRNKASIGSTVNLKLTFYGTQNVSAPDLPDIRGFNWRYLGQFLRMDMANGRTATSITHNYVLMPLETGEFAVPPLSVYYDGQAYSSEAIPIEVTSGPVGPPEVTQEASGEAAIQNLGDKVFLTMETGRRKAYVNEALPVKVKFFYTMDLTIKEVSYPEFAHEGFTADKFDEHKEYREVFRGIPYNVVELNTYVSAARSGEFTLGPATLKFNLLIKRNPHHFSAFFGGYDSYSLTLESASLPVSVIEAPLENAPADFTGAMGNYRFYLEANPKEVKVGDPITLKMTVTGEGNYNTVKVPRVKVNDDFKLYDPAIKQDRTGKVFEQVIIPKNDRIREIPPITFSFFDTASGRFRSLTEGPVPVNVKPLSKGESLKIFETSDRAERHLREKETLGRDIIYIKENIGAVSRKGAALGRNKLFVGVQFIPFIMVVLTLISHRKKERLQTDIRYARRLAAPRKAKKNLFEAKRLLTAKDTAAFFDAVFNTLQEYLGGKFHLPTAGITSNVAETLEKYNIGKELLDNLRECFKSCDMARYAPTAVTKEEMARTMKLLESIIDSFERIKL